MNDSAPLPVSGGSYIRDPDTGALSLADTTAPAEPVAAPATEPAKPAVKGAVKSASKPASQED